MALFTAQQSVFDFISHWPDTRLEKSPKIGPFNPYGLRDLLWHGHVRAVDKLAHGTLGKTFFELYQSCGRRAL